jgi:siroheme synthase
MPDARVVVGTVADIGRRVEQAAVQAPAVLFVGEVVARRVESVVVAGGYSLGAVR